ncbi:MAG: hypothetical protein MR943_01965 [Lachnobacterium sp.]|nr:hypothetical protein [Lachnobacterium sp.]
MRKMWKKSIALLCAFAMVFTLVPMQTQAATKKAAFTKSYTSLYENDTNKGVYTYTVKNLIKGQKVKWSISGTGKSYAKLSKSSTSVSGTTSSNKLTIRTKKKIAAKNKTVIVTAKVYNKNGKLQMTLKSKTGKIKVKPTKIEVLASDWDGKTFLVNQTYQMRSKVTPANATSTNTWSVVDASGSSVDYITKTGAFTPKKDGAYVITVTSKIGSKTIKSNSMNVQVQNTMIEAKQTAADALVAVYSSNAKNTLDTKKLKITNAAGANIVIKKVAFSADGTEISMQTSSLLIDNATYQVTDGVSRYNVTAHVGMPEKMEILTSKITVNKDTPIEYALYDAYGIDVKAAYPGTVTSDEKVTVIKNGYVKDLKIYMNTVGQTGIVKLDYTSTENKNLILTATTTVTCVAASTSTDTNLTFTESATKPNYDAASYKDDRSIASGSNYYVHFRALDEDKAEIKYDSVKFESTDPDTLIINQASDGTVTATAVKTGTVNVIVTAAYGKMDYTYEYEVIIAEPAYLKTLTLSNSVIQMSNVQVYGYKGYINIEGRDQYGHLIDLKDEAVTITDNNTVKNSIATYDAVNDRLVIDASGRAIGSYNYTINMTMNGHKASENFTVVVQAPPYNGASSYKVEMDHPVLDLQIGSGMTSTELVNSKNVAVRLAEYRGGVFCGYSYIYSAKIMKDGSYYGTDLTQNGSGTEINAGSGQVLNLKAVTLNKDACTKAQTGMYAIELRFIPNGVSTSSYATATALLEVTDSQTNPQVAVVRTTANKTCKTALELAQNCLEVQGVNGSIVSATVTGSNSVDGNYAIAAGYALNVKSVVVLVKTALADNKTVVSNYTISVGKTLRNM